MPKSPASQSEVSITWAEPGHFSEMRRDHAGFRIGRRRAQYPCRDAMPGMRLKRAVNASVHSWKPNPYFALLKSSTYLPRAKPFVSEKLIQALDRPPLRTIISQFHQLRALDRVTHATRRRVTAAHCPGDSVLGVQPLLRSRPVKSAPTAIQAWDTCDGCMARCTHLLRMPTDRVLELPRVGTHTHRALIGRERLHAPARRPSWRGF